MNYQKQAIDFAKKHGVKLKINSVEYKKHFATDKENRYVFNITLSRNGKKYTLNFGQSIKEGNNEPTMYDVLCCVKKYGYESFEDFCSSMGYDDDSRSAHKIYLAVCKEYKGISRLFGDIIDELQEIQ